MINLLALLASACIADGLLLQGGGIDLYEAYSGVPGFPTCFRQPVLTVINATHYLAFAEGRDNGYCSGGADGDNSSIWVRTSGDGGSTWTPAAMLYDAPPMPDYLSAVFDARSGRALLFIQTSPNLVTHSDDAGATWSKPSPINITLPHGVTASPGVAHGIQVSGALCSEPSCGGAAGRLIVAWVCHKKTPPRPIGSRSDISCAGCYTCLAVSDDGGKTWEVGASAVSTQEGSREASLVQLPHSSHPSGTGGAVIYATQRNMGATPGHRWHSISVDSGSSLSIFGEDPSLPDVVTKNWTGIVAGAARIGETVVVSTPKAQAERADLALFSSVDSAATWDAGQLLVQGPAGYSDMQAINGTHGAVLCENGAQEFSGKISFFVFEV